MKPIDFTKILFYPVRAKCTTEDIFAILMEVGMVEMRVTAAMYYNVAFLVKGHIEAEIG